MTAPKETMIPNPLSAAIRFENSAKMDPETPAKAAATT
jgi:hypothetical protein